MKNVTEKEFYQDEEGIKYLHSQAFFDELTNLVANNTLKEFLNPNIKKSIYDYLWYLRENKQTSSKTERETFPFDFISIELQLRPIPFDVIDLNGKVCKNSDSRFL